MRRVYTIPGYVFLVGNNSRSSKANVLGERQSGNFSGAPSFCVHEHISRRRFESILKHLKFTRKECPPFKHPFHLVNDLIAAFNEHTQSCFNPGWINCLDKSMLVWTNMWTCPGWMFVPGKPQHPMENEYHTFCCGFSVIMYAIENTARLLDFYSN
jgi:hypothetical protein